MLPRTTTYNLQVFTRPPPTSVTYDLTTPNVALITVPATSTWTSSPHWHETHTEYLEILQGTALVTLGRVTKPHTPSDGIVTVPRNTVHEWRRAAPGGEDLVVREWTDPSDGQKEVFFRMLNSFLTEPEPGRLHRFPVRLPGWMVVTVQMMLIFRACDNWPVVGKEGVVGWVLMRVVFGVAGVLGAVMGLKGVYPEYVDDDLRRRVDGGKGEKGD